MERLVQDEVMKFLTVNNELSDNQHGFRPRHSCQTQLLETFHQWAASLDKGACTHAIFIDFATVDTVPHQRLLMKLDSIGVRGPILKWIRAFFTNRRQRVYCGENCSNWLMCDVWCV